MTEAEVAELEKRLAARSGWNWRQLDANPLLQERWCVFAGSTDPVQVITLSEDRARQVVAALSNPFSKEFGARLLADWRGQAKRIAEKDAALQNISDCAPQVKPERQDFTGNADDSYSDGWHGAAWYAASLARAALSSPAEDAAAEVGA